MNVTFKHPIAVGIALICLFSIPAWLLTANTEWSLLTVLIVFWIAWGYAFKKRKPEKPEGGEDARPAGKKKDWLDRI